MDCLQAWCVTSLGAHSQQPHGCSGALWQGDARRSGRIVGTANRKQPARTGENDLDLRVPGLLVCR